MTEAQNTILEKLEVSRKELLDLGLRNSLLNFRATARSLEIVDELSTEVFRLLIPDQKEMSFKALPESESARAENIDSLEFDFDELFGEVSKEDAVAKRHTDTKLQTRRTSDVLLKTLLKIHTESRSYLEEQGINVLYLALGFLDWYEDDSAQSARKAPLILIPVELTRGNARETFKIKYSGEDLEPNLSLEAKLKSDFGIALPGFDDEVSIQSYFGQVQTAVASKSRWMVNPDQVFLGFFSFGKFRMYKDLDPDVWPEESDILNHEVLNSLLGDGFPDCEPRFPEGDHLDAHVDPAEIHFVKDADSTQTVAVLEVMTGKHLVIQGPPGTGKSQTITNIIAECIGQGKTVLFVAEKMAALEVVKRRLDEVHIGDTVLELHSHKSNKKAVIEELARTLNLGRPIVDDGEDDLNSLRECRARLNSYCEEANLSVLNSGVSYVDALGYCLQINKKYQELPRFNFDEMKGWSAIEFRDRIELLEEVADYISNNGVPMDNRFFVSHRRSFSPAQQSNLRQFLQATVQALVEARTHAVQLSARLGFNEPESIKSCLTLVSAAKRSFEAPRLEGVAITRDGWQRNRDEIRQAIEAGTKISTTQAMLADILIDAAWQADVLQMRQAFMACGGRWWRFLSRSYRQAKKSLLGFCRAELPGDDAICLKTIDQILDVQTNLEIFNRHSEMASALFGSQWQALDSDWDVLSTVSDWIIKLYDEIGQGDVPRDILDFLNGDLQRDGLDSSAQELESRIEKSIKRMAEIHDVLDVNGVDPLVLHLDDAITQLRDWTEHTDDMYQLVRYRQLQDDMEEKGLAFLTPVVDSWALPDGTLIDVFRLTFYEGLINEAYEDRPEIKRFDRAAHENRIARFRNLDQLQFAHAQARLAVLHFESIPRLSGGGQIGTINREINKKRRHMPIRRLIADAGMAIQQFKPIFMMSPMSIAQYLSPGAVKFDVVIFDEASQVKTVDAFGAIMRGKQVVVVGDTRQMPPTDFFGRQYEGDEEDESATGDIESVLGLFLSKGAPQSMLRWHYRSRHESLIAVSNFEFYENKLVVFPSSGTNQQASGLHFHHLPDTVYDRGRSSTNREEARSVAEAAMDHARQNSEMSLGIVAFSSGQRDMILLQLEQLRHQDESCEHFFADHPDEPFFVKNLENVQGDERDVIMISIGYGRDANRRLSRNFGPVNRDGGHRRLNVLISRAKQVMRVFSNFTGDDLKVSNADPLGVRTLKHFLKYAETGELEIPTETGKLPDSPFEEEVISALRGEGFEIEPQVGTAGYFIDLAVRDPNQPGRYLLAIECDGASYHSSRSARDRDRLRQGVLEGLGWRFHRIWSTDWFRNPGAEIARAVDAIETARRSAIKTTANTASTRMSSISRSEDSVQSKEVSVLPYVKAQLRLQTSLTEIHEDNSATIAQKIHEVVSVESPVHVDQITQRLLDAYGITRAGNRVQAAVKRGVGVGLRKNLFLAHGDFLYRFDQNEFPYRNRETLATADRKPQYVPPDEWDAAILETVGNSIDIELGDLVSEVLSKLGFKRATSGTAEIVEERINELTSQKKLIVQNRRYRVSA